MFHDDLMSEGKRRQFHDALGRFAGAVGACLRMFLWAAQEVQRKAYESGSDTHAVPQMLMFDFAEPIDGVSILARAASGKNCSQLLRTALEIRLSLMYIWEHKGTYKQRCLSYEYNHLRDKLRWAQRCDPESPVGKQLRAELAGTRWRTSSTSGGSTPPSAETWKAG